MARKLPPAALKLNQGALNESLKYPFQWLTESTAVMPNFANGNSMFFSMRSTAFVTSVPFSKLREDAALQTVFYNGQQIDLLAAPLPYWIRSRCPLAL